MTENRFNVESTRANFSCAAIPNRVMVKVGNGDLLLTKKRKKILDSKSGMPYSGSRAADKGSGLKPKLIEKDRQMIEGAKEIYPHSDRRGRRSETVPHLKLAALAVEVGVGADYLSKLLRGIGNPSVPLLQKLAAAMRLSVPDLLDQLEAAREAGKKKKKRA